MVVVEGGKCPTPRKKGELFGRGNVPGENIPRGEIYGSHPYYAYSPQEYHIAGIV